MKKINVFLVLGVLFVLASAALIVVEKTDAAQHERKTEEMISEILEVLPSRSTSFKGQSTELDMPVISIDGQDFCGLLEVKKLGIQLPVADHWKLKGSFTSRYCGSCYEGTMRIGGKGIDFVIQLDLNDRITIVDLLGQEFSYTVDRIDRANELTKEKMDSFDDDLILFAYLSAERKYVLVFCNH